MSVYYNENDAFAAAWLAELMKDGLIPHGEIDTRSIEAVSGLADADERPEGLERGRSGGFCVRRAESHAQSGPWRCSADGEWVEHAQGDGWQQRRPESGQWSLERGCCFIDCADGKARRVKPSIQPLAHGVPNRVGTLRGAGNAIVGPLAAEFITAYMETCR